MGVTRKHYHFYMCWVNFCLILFQFLFQKSFPPIRQSYLPLPRILQSLCRALLPPNSAVSLPSLTSFVILCKILLSVCRFVLRQVSRILETSTDRKFTKELQRNIFFFYSYSRIFFVTPRRLGSIAIVGWT